MLEKSLGLMFFLKQPRNYDGGEMYIYLKITVDGVSKDLSIKRSWLPSRWNSKGNRAIGNKEDAKVLNEFLDVMQNKAYDARKHLIDRGKVVTALAIVELLSGINERKWMLLLLFEGHNKDLKKMIGKGVAKGTYTNFNTSYKHTCKFIKVIFKVDDMNIRSLDLELIKKLYNWCRTDLELNHNSALKNIANMKNEEMMVPDEVISSKIYYIREQKVMLDEDLAQLYDVTTGNLNKAVARNIKRFPDDFMFRLTDEEFKNLLFQNGIASWGGRRQAPNAFTEDGLAMLSGILSSDRPIRVNIQIICGNFSKFKHAHLIRFAVASIYFNGFL